MDSLERDKLYDWLENSPAGIDPWLRRMVLERLAELELFVDDHRTGPQGERAEELLAYERPQRRPGGRQSGAAAEARRSRE